MALTVSTAPQYTGNFQVAPLAPQPSLAVSSTPGTMGSTYNTQPTQLNPQTQSGGGSTGVLGLSAYGTSGQGVAPSVADIAEANRIAGVRTLAGINRQRFETGAQTALNSNNSTYANDSNRLVGDIRTGQDSINSGRANNALNLRRSMSSIAGGVRQGLRSGGVDLANMNALDSGASDALARAWARAGGMQAGAAQNEAQLQSNAFNASQTKLDADKNGQLAQLQQWRSDKTGEISSQLWSDLELLEAQSANQGAGGIVDMGARDRLISAAAAKLDGIDQTTNESLQGIRGFDPNQVNAQAFQMEQAGAQVANPFAVEAVGQGRQNPGAALGQFNTAPRYRSEEAQPYNPFLINPEEQLA